MDHQLEVAYVGVEVPDPSTLTSFFGDVIGLVPGGETPSGALTWRDDDKAHRVLVSEGPTNDVAFLGIEALGADAFEHTAHRLTEAGFPLVDGAPGEAADRLVKRMAWVTSPWGVRVELVEGLEGGSAFRSPLVPGGFLTGGAGFGHVVFATTALEEPHRFLTEGLGFVQSDWLEMELAAGIALEVRFYHCNSRHHSIALARAPFEVPQRLHHIMFETNERDDTGAAFDRAWASGLPIPNGLGRHDNDRMFSFYVASPAGFMVEVGHGARVVTGDWDDNRRYDRISLWGHQSLRSA